MLYSVALIFLVGLSLGFAFTKAKLPGLLGMLITGLVLGPYGLNVIDASVLAISAELRQIALVIILARAGLSLKVHDLLKVGRPAVLMCFVPACFEIAAMVWFAPRLLGITTLEAAIMGSVVAAVSPAVVVPRMLKLMEESYGSDKSIPQLIMAGASVDDVFVIVLFSSFISFAHGGEVSLLLLGTVPIAIALGIAGGMVIGTAFSLLFRKVQVRDTAKVLIVLSTSFLLLVAEKALEQHVPFSGLLAVMAVGVTLLRLQPHTARTLSAQFSELWTGAEVLLFVLVGATVDMRFAFAAGNQVLLLLSCGLLFRMLGVGVCMLKTTLTAKERLFCMVAYIPKATVQAAIGGIPLALGLECGSIVLTVAVLSILITAPLGAFGVDMTYKRWLQPDSLRNNSALQPTD